jgi:Carboxylesterase family
VALDRLVYANPRPVECQTTTTGRDCAKRPLRVSLMAFLLFLAFLPLVTSSALVTLSSGTFRGLAVNGTVRWLGIRYAQRPLALCFEAPGPISRLVEGIRDALNFSYACP